MSATTGRYLTADGVLVTLGQRVWTNDLRAGTVVALAVHDEMNMNIDSPQYGDVTVWHHVLEDGKEVAALCDGSRIATRHPFTREAPPEVPPGFAEKTYTIRVRTTEQDKDLLETDATLHLIRRATHGGAIRLLWGQEGQVT